MSVQEYSWIVDRKIEDQKRQNNPRYMSDDDWEDLRELHKSRTA